MILILKPHISATEAESLVKRLQWMKLDAVLSHTEEGLRIGVVNGADASIDFQQFVNIPEVDDVLPFTKGYKLASSLFKPERTIVRVKEHEIGGEKLAVMAGPCSIESEEQMHEVAAVVAAQGATCLRGGAFKPRTSPYDFQGLEEVGLRYMRDAANKYGLACVSEVMDTQDVALLAAYVDILQIGARNMQNFSLLKAVGKAGKPVLLKRGLSATYTDFLMAAEYILQTGNPNVILCERGIRTFETHTRNVLDIAAVPVLHELSHLPVIVDPSHGTGLRHLVCPMAMAAVAAGADGLMIEVHPFPDRSVSDAKQTISFEMFEGLMNQCMKR